MQRLLLAVVFHLNIVRSMTVLSASTLELCNKKSNDTASNNTNSSSNTSDLGITQCDEKMVVLIAVDNQDVLFWHGNFVSQPRETIWRSP